SVSTIGVGDDYNEDLMAGLAEASDANYYYVKDAEKLPEIFAKELGSLLTVAAREIRLEVTCPADVHPLGFIGRSEQFEGGPAVVAEREWMLNAVKKDEAIAAADAGRYERAAQQFLEQAVRLESQCGNAPTGLRVQFEKEVQNLRQRAQELQQGQYTSGSRKA